MDKVKALELLKQALNEIPDLGNLRYDDEKFPLWRSRIRVILEDAFGNDSKEYQVFSQSGKRAHIRTLMMPDSVHQNDYLENLKSLEISLKSIIQKYEILGVEEKPTTTVELPPKAFIAHGGKSGVLDKLCEFIEALDIKSIIVELSASKGMTVDDKVNKYIKDADCGIVLATRGGIVDEKSKKQHPRLNVIDELERLRAAFPEKTILLLERGVDLPSNISGLTYELFARQSMDRAFTAIARELTAFGILKAVKPPVKEQEFAR